MIRQRKKQQNTWRCTPKSEGFWGCFFCQNGAFWEQFGGYFAYNSQEIGGKIAPKLPPFCLLVIGVEEPVKLLINLHK